MEASKSNVGLLKQFSKYVSLNVMGMIGLSCYILMDTFFVARGLGSDGLAALNLAIPVYSFIHGLGLMIGMGGSTRYSILQGNSDKSEGNKVFSQAVIITFLLGISTALLGLLLSDSISFLLGAKDNIHQMTSTYIRVILLFSPFFLMNNVIICFVRNDHNPNIAMLGMVLGSIANIILDWVFIFPLNMGMFGAVLATGISPVISMLVLSTHFFKKTSSLRYIKLKLKLNCIKDILSLGSASLIQELSSGIVMIVYNSIILYLYGNIGVAAYAVVANIALVVIAIFNGISQGMQPLLSMNYGKQNTQNIKKIFRYGIITSIVVAILIYSITMWNTEGIVNLFNEEGNASLLKLGVVGLRLYFTAFFFMGINIIATVYFSSTDRPIQSFTISLFRGFIVIIPMVLLLAFLFEMTGVWISLTVTEFIMLVVVLFMLYKGRRALK